MLQAERFNKACNDPLDRVWSVKWLEELFQEAPREGWSGQSLPGTLTDQGP